MIIYKKQCLLVLCIAVSLFSTAFAQENALELASLFADNMVLQQKTDAAIWGKAKPSGEVSITTSWSKRTYQTVAGDDGNWRTDIKTPKAGGPFTVTVTSGNETIVLKNVLSGEVWLCSGQSNMQWRMKAFGPERWKDDVDKANYPNIRYCQITQTLALEPQESVGTEWSICSPETAYDYSAIAFFFGTELHKELDVPIGLIGVNWGGSSAQAWTSEERLSKEFPEFNDKIQTYPKIIQESGGLYGRGKKAPQGINHRVPATLYNGMLKPLMPFAFRGVIWYQGESNVGNAIQYRTLFPAMIEDWRNNWNIGNFPFYYVQIAPFNYGENRGGERLSA